MFWPVKLMRSPANAWRMIAMVSRMRPICQVDGRLVQDDYIKVHTPQDTPEVSTELHAAPQGILSGAAAARGKSQGRGVFVGGGCGDCRGCSANAV